LAINMYVLSMLATTNDICSLSCTTSWKSYYKAYVYTLH
jgi:hypothetical protein